MIRYKQVYYCDQIEGEMNSKAEIQSSKLAYAIYKIKRLAKILVVCAGIVVTLASIVASLFSLSVFVSSKSELFIKKQGGGVGGAVALG
jgi:lipopolysaccharide/colanic/teichoic acid biosynthesis glycosyltransferase